MLGHMDLIGTGIVVGAVVWAHGLDYHHTGETFQGQALWGDLLNSYLEVLSSILRLECVSREL